MPQLRWSGDDLSSALRQAAAQGEGLRFRWVRAGRSLAAVGVAARPGGFTMAVPEGSIPYDELDEAREAGYTGAVGPCFPAAVRMEVRGRAADDDTIGEVLLVDLAAELASEFVSFTTGSYRNFAGFASHGGLRGWPVFEDLLEAFALFVSELPAELTSERVAAYATEIVEVAGAGAPGEKFELPMPASSSTGPAPRAAAPGPAQFSVATPRGSGGGAGRGVSDQRPLLAELSELRREVRALQAERASAADGEPLGDDGPEDPLVPEGRADPQFFSEGRRLGLSDGELQRLLGLAGPMPERLADPAAARLRGSGSGAAAVAGVKRSLAATAMAPPPRPATAAESPPPSDIMQLLLSQQQLLFKLVADRVDSPAAAATAGGAPSLDALLGGTGGSLLDDTKVSGARGCAARIALKQMLQSRPTLATSAVRRNLAQAVDKAPEAVVPGDMRRYFTETVPFGSFACLTYFAFLMAKLWEEAEEAHARMPSDGAGAEEFTARFERLHATIALGCCFAEQVATEGGNRYQLGWLLTGLEEPPFASTQAHKPRPGAAPHGRLVEAQWVAAQLAYLRDLDLMTERMKRQNNLIDGPAKGSGKADSKDKPP